MFPVKIRYTCPDNFWTLRKLEPYAARRGALSVPYLPGISPVFSRVSHTVVCSGIGGTGFENTQLSEYSRY